MSLVNPSNLYHGAAVVLDSTPSTRFAMQLMAHQQAKKDSLDQYYSKLQEQTLNNEDKMRPIDVNDDPNGNFKGWGSKLNDWQMFYMNPDNKQKILKPSLDNYKTLNTFNAMHSNLIADARASKDKLSQETKIDALNNSGRWHPTDLDQIEGHQLSKSNYDPTRMITENDPESGLPITREPSISHLSLNIPEFDAQKQIQFEKNVTGQIKPDTVSDEKNARVDKATGEIYIPQITAYTPEKIKSIADNVRINPRTPEGVYYENKLTELAKIPNALDQVSKAYQQVYGAADAQGNPNIVDTPQKLAQADIILKKQAAGQTKEKLVSDWQTKQRLQQQFQQAQQSRSFAHAVEMQRVGFNHTDTKNEKVQQENNQWIDSFIDNGIEKSKNYPSIDGTRTVPLDGVVGKALAKGKMPAIALQISEDGNTFTPVYPKLDASGNPTSEPNPALTQPMDRQQVKLALGYKTVSKKDLGNVMNSVTPTKTYSIKGKSYSHSDLLKGGWTEDQINQAVKSGKIK